jgi:hypothetical protein
MTHFIDNTGYPSINAPLPVVYIYALNHLEELFADYHIEIK